MNNAPMIMPADNLEIKTAKEEVYKSALEIILSLCNNYSISLMDIQAICETVLKEKEKKNEQ